MAIADLVKTTLGPKGMVWPVVTAELLGSHPCTVCTAAASLAPVRLLASRILHVTDDNREHKSSVQDKILQSLGRGQEIVVTNDGATILKSLYVDNPAAKVLVGMQAPPRANGRVAPSLVQVLVACVGATCHNKPTADKCPPLTPM